MKTFVFILCYIRYLFHKVNILSNLKHRPSCFAVNFFFLCLFQRVIETIILFYSDDIIGGSKLVVYFASRKRECERVICGGGRGGGSKKLERLK